MKFVVGLVFLLILIACTGGYFFFNASNVPQQIGNEIIKSEQQIENSQVSPTETAKTDSDPEVASVIAGGLDTPWAIAFLPASPAGGPNGGMLITERQGTIRLLDSSGKLQNEPVAKLNSVKEIGEGGLLGIVLHPDFSSNHFVYLYYTYSSSGDNTKNRVVKMKYENNKLSDEQILIDQIPGASNHNGGRIKFGPDKALYITTGDASEPSFAQDKNSTAGKILRVTEEGKAFPGNPFNNLTFSYGHRNPQGITWDKNGSLWETEHGPSGGSLGTGNDEVNKIELGKNYGWSVIQGGQTRAGMETPVKYSGSNVTWAPAGVAIIEDKLFYGGLRGQALFSATLNNGQLIDLKEHFKGQYGRIREVIKGPDNMLYITTSNRDGRGNALNSDDRIIKINPAKL